MKKNGQPGLTGFTLVELLIVIALIAILSVAVLATINPIEQTNKARDAQFKNDSAEVLSAYERYFASNNQYPWNNTSQVDFIIPNTPMAVGSSDPRFGVVSYGDGTTGVLISSSELKSSFAGKVPFAAASTDQDRLYVYHNGLDSNYVCFCPKATANRVGPKAADLKCLTAAEGVGGQLLNIGANCNTLPAGTPFSCTIGVGGTGGGDNVANLICVPEGSVQ